MKARFDNSETFGESLSARGEDFWHSVWKGIEDITDDDDLSGKSEVAPEAPRDYVVDNENRGANRSA